MTIHPGTATRSNPVTAHHPEDHVQYQTLAALTAAHQDDLRREAAEHRLGRLARAAAARREPADDHAHAHPLAHQPAQGRVASLRIRLGHALVTAGTLVEGHPAEDTVRSN